VGSSLGFRPHAIIATDRSVPSPIFVAALVGVEKILQIDFDTSLPKETYVQRALAKLPEQTIAFGRPVGVTINYAPDRAVRYDLKGDLSKLSPRQSKLAKRISLYRQTKRTCLYRSRKLLDCGKYRDGEVLSRSISAEGSNSVL
jgi:hypothetical protein